VHKRRIVRRRAPTRCKQAAYPGAYPVRRRRHGMVPVTYQAYPRGPQQVYYVPRKACSRMRGGSAAKHTGADSKDSVVDQLEGFSLSQTFSETFKHHESRAEEEYAMVGSALTTPPIEMVTRNWPSRGCSSAC